MKALWLPLALFIASALFFAGGSLFFAGPAGAATPPAPPSDKTLRHVVLFDLPDNLPADTLAEIESAAYRMQEAVPSIAALEWGANLSSNDRNHGFTHCLLVTFGSVEALEAYGPHAGHAAFKEVLGPHVENLLVLDYFAAR